MSQPNSLPKPHLLIVDDDDRIRHLLKRFLDKQGFRITEADRAEKARKLIQYFMFDLMVFDIMMPGEDGLSLLDWKNEKNNTPVLLLTARSEASDRIEGFKTGADDYLIKPFEPEELLLRIHAILKRSQTPEPERSEVCFGPYRFNLKTHRLYDKDRLIALTRMESEILAQLTQHPGQIIERSRLSKNQISNRALDIQMTRLRKKIETNPKLPLWIQTVRGQGYKLICDV